jgi:hypothetical protein
MASKGIINGTGKDSCSPATCITRADYMVIADQEPGLTADFKENFADVKSARIIMRRSALQRNWV